MKQRALGSTGMEVTLIAMGSALMGYRNPPND